MHILELHFDGVAAAETPVEKWNINVFHFTQLLHQNAIVFWNVLMQLASKAICHHSGNILI